MILDYIEKIEIPQKIVEDHFDSIMALARLGEGLFWINQEVRKIEQQVHRKAVRSNTQLAIVGGILENQPFGVLSCAFQWYAVSACNYAQLVGWLATQDKNAAKEYVKKIMPRLLKYRNKVAAHFAITDPQSDNEADLAASVMTHIIYVNGRLYAAALSPVKIVNGSEVNVSNNLSWSLTYVHERLISRFWANGMPRSYQSLQVPPGEIKFNIRWADMQES